MQRFVRPVLFCLLVLAIFISRITTSHVRSVGKREYDYVSLSNEISELLSLLEAKTKSEEISSLKDEFRFISPSSKEEAIERLEKMDNVQCYDWFLCFKSLPREILEEKLLHKNTGENICN